MDISNCKSLVELIGAVDRTRDEGYANCFLIALLGRCVFCCSFRNDCAAALAANDITALEHIGSAKLEDLSFDSKFSTGGLVCVAVLGFSIALQARSKS